MTRSCLWLCRQEIWVQDTFCKLSTNFCIDNELYEAILFQFPGIFSLLYKKKLFFMDLKSTLEWVQPVKRRETWRNSRTARSFDWTDQFSRMWKTSFAILIGRILFCSCEKHRPLLWLARTLRQSSSMCISLVTLINLKRVAVASFSFPTTYIINSFSTLKNCYAPKTLFTWSGGPRSSGVSFFCFVSSRAWKQKKPTPLDRGPPLHVNRPLDLFKEFI